MDLIRHMMGQKVKHHLSRLVERCPECDRERRSSLLDSYVEGGMTCRECRSRLKFLRIPMPLGMDMIAKGFGLTRNGFRTAIKENVVLRRALLSFLEGMGRFGVRMPQPPGAPFFIIVSVTQRCNLRCSFCYNEEYVDGSGPKDMDGDMVRSIIDQMADAGCLGIGFNGGEPTLRKDIFELISYAASKDLIPLLGTNGVLVDKAYARRLKEAGLQYAQVSLDGKEATHDSIRGTKGTYKRTLASIRNLVEEGIFVSVVMVATRQNWKEFPHVLDVARSCKAAKLEVLDFQGLGRAKDDTALDLDPHERDILAQRVCEQWAKEVQNGGSMNIIYKNPFFVRAMRRVFPKVEATPIVGASFPEGTTPHLSYGKRFQKGIFSVQAPFASTVTCCEAGLFAFYIDVDGTMTPCPYMPLPIGNIKNDDLHDIWVDSPILMSLRDRANLKGTCRSCNERTLCGGCRARAFNRTGDVLASDPLCSKVSDH